MPISTESLNRKLFKVLSKYKPKPLDTSGEVTPVEDEADVIKFKFTKDGVEYGDVFATIDDNHALTLYYGDDVADSPSARTKGLDYNDSWEGLLEFLSRWAHDNRLKWNPDNNKDHLVQDMARRKHMKKKENIGEGYYPMGKKASYSDNIPTVKIVIEHTRQIEEGEQRYRNINKIFLENQLGERFLLDTKKPGVARVYARHVAEGGKVNDERWGHISSLCEEYNKMAGFVRATRNGQFNESAQKLVESGIQHYQSLRETLSRMTGKRGYNMYFESWTPALMEDEVEETNLNELFVQETLDPRIESVMPILSKLHKQVSEMKETIDLAEWADSLIEGGDGGEASEEPVFTEPVETLPTDGADAPEDDLDEGLGDVVKKVGSALKKVGSKALDTLGHGSDEELLKDLQRRSGVPASAQHGKPSMAKTNEEESIKSNNPIGIPEEDIDESALQAYLGDKKYGKDGMDALRKAGQEHASEKKMQNIRAKFSNKEKEVAEEVDMGQYDAVKSTPKGKEDDDVFKKFREKVRQYGDELGQRQKEKDVDEGLDANQKRVGQLGPTEPVGKNEKNLRGKLVGANENFINTVDQAVVSEMDKSQTPPGRDDYVKGPEGKATPITPKKMADDAKKVLDKQKVKEGQSDLDRILIIMNHRR